MGLESSHTVLGQLPCSVEFSPFRQCSVQFVCNVFLGMDPCQSAGWTPLQQHFYGGNLLIYQHRALVQWLRNRAIMVGKLPSNC